MPKATTQKTTDEDRSLLRYAGCMGHTVCGVTGEPGKRRVACETCDVPSARRIAGSDPTLRVYRKRRAGGWAFVPGV